MTPEEISTSTSIDSYILRRTSTKPNPKSNKINYKFNHVPHGKGELYEVKSGLKAFEGIFRNGIIHGEGTLYSNWMLANKREPKKKEENKEDSLDKSGRLGSNGPNLKLDSRKFNSRPTKKDNVNVVDSYNLNNKEFFYIDYDKKNKELKEVMKEFETLEQEKIENLPYYQGNWKNCYFDGYGTIQHTPLLKFSGMFKEGMISNVQATGHGVFDDVKLDARLVIDEKTATTADDNSSIRYIIRGDGKIQNLFGLFTGEILEYNSDSIDKYVKEM